MIHWVFHNNYCPSRRFYKLPEMTDYFCLLYEEKETLESEPGTIWIKYKLYRNGTLCSQKEKYYCCWTLSQYIKTHLIQGTDNIALHARHFTASRKADCFLFTSAFWLAYVFSFSLPHLFPDYVQEQYNPPPFNYSDPALHYMSHCSPRIIDNITPRQRHR